MLYDSCLNDILNFKMIKHDLGINSTEGNVRKQARRM